MPNRMADRLPDNYKKDKSNTEKLFRMIVDEIDNLNDTNQRIKNWSDIDQAEGKVLDDDFGETLNVKRDGMSDDEYRLMLKIKIISNMSDGDIPTLNQVIPVLINGKFERIKQGFLFDDEPLPKEPAAFLIRVIASRTENNNIPFRAIERITAGGVRAYWELIFADLIKIESRYKKEEMGWYIQPKVGTFSANQKANQMSYIYFAILKTETEYNLEEQVWSLYPASLIIENKYFGSKQNLVKTNTLKAGQEVLYN